MNFLTKLLGKNKYSLVISGGGVRAFYAMGILKAIEECDLKKNIKSIYGVSAGAILGAYRSAGYSAEWIFERFSNISVFGLKTFNLISKKSFLKNNFLHEMFLEDLPNSFDGLNMPLTVGTTDAKKAKYVVYKKGNLIEPLLGSMAIPGIFPPISYKGCNLMDGGLINNFPVDIAKKDHPNHNIIGIFLNKFVEDQSTETIMEGLIVGYEILLRAGNIEKFDLVDELFYRDLNISILSNNSKKMKKLFDMGYKDGIKKFGK